MTTTSPMRNIICWTFGILFLLLGILYMIFIHIIPATFYMVLSLIYFPPIDTWMKKKIGISIPFWLKMVIGIFILWATLAVGELVEMVD